MLAKDKILHCLRCGEVMIRDGRDFWTCPRCGGEWWDDESKITNITRAEKEKRTAVELRKQLLWSVGKRFTTVLPHGPVDRSKGGSKSSGRKRSKPKPKPKQIWEI